MDITAVLILITTDEEMKKKNTGIAVKEVQLERDFGGGIGLTELLSVIYLSKRCIHEDCTEGVVVNKDNKTVLLIDSRDRSSRGTFCWLKRCWQHFSGKYLPEL